MKGNIYERIRKTLNRIKSISRSKNSISIKAFDRKHDRRTIKKPLGDIGRSDVVGKKTIIKMHTRINGIDKCKINDAF